MTVIVVEEQARRFGDLEAVKNVSFSVRARGVFGFLGPDGAGKGTTIDRLCTLLKPNAGRATPRGRHGILRSALGSVTGELLRGPAPVLALRPASMT